MMVALALEKPNSVPVPGQQVRQDCAVNRCSQSRDATKIASRQQYSCGSQHVPVIVAPKKSGAIIFSHQSQSFRGVPLHRRSR